MHKIIIPSLLALSMSACAQADDSGNTADNTSEEAAITASVQEVEEEVEVEVETNSGDDVEEMAQSDEMDDDRGLSTLPSGTYKIDPTHGYVFMSYTHMGFSSPILRFTAPDATVELNTDNPAASTLVVTIDPSSIDSGVERFDTHLKSGDFFDVENHGDITFSSININMADGYSGTMSGNLTIKGVTKPVTLDVTLNKAGTHPTNGKPTFGISATGDVLRSDYGLDLYAPAVSDEVELQIEAEFSKE